MGIEQWLMPEFVPAEAPGEVILCPDDLAADLKPRNFHGGLEFALRR
jgi:hypothetical protein